MRADRYVDAGREFGRLLDDLVAARRAGPPGGTPASAAPADLAADPRGRAARGSPGNPSQHPLVPGPQHRRWNRLATLRGTGQTRVDCPCHRRLPRFVDGPRRDSSPLPSRAGDELLQAPARPRGLPATVNRKPQPGSLMTARQSAIAAIATQSRRSDHRLRGARRRGDLRRVRVPRGGPAAVPRQADLQARCGARSTASSRSIRSSPTPSRTASRSGRWRTARPTTPTGSCR